MTIGILNQIDRMTKMGPNIRELSLAGLDEEEARRYLYEGTVGNERKMFEEKGKRAGFSIPYLRSLRK